MTSQRKQGGLGAAWEIALGPGARLAGIDGLARAASARRDPGVGVAFERLEDLAQLLAPRGARGRLVLDGDHLPVEDLGFVRRFLGGASGWSVLLVGEDAGHRAARAALSLPRVRWMPWPPDLAQLDEIVAAPEDLRPSRPASARTEGVSTGTGPAPGVQDVAASLQEIAELAERAQGSAQPQAEGESRASGDLARLARMARTLSYRVAPPPPAEEALDVGSLLEDLLAALTLRGKKAPRFLYRGDRGIFVHGGRAALNTSLESLLLLSRGCAGPEEMIRVQLAGLPAPEESGSPGEAQLQIDFPAGALAAIDPRTPLAAAVFEPIGGVGPHDLAAAQAVIGALGGQIELGFPEEGAAQLRIDLPADVEASDEPEGAAGPQPAAAVAGGEAKAG